MVKNPPANVGDARDTSSIPGSEDPLKKGWQPTPVFSPGESHGQRSLEGYSPWGHKQLDMTEHTHTCLCRLVSHRVVTHLQLVKTKTHTICEAQ